MSQRLSATMSSSSIFEVRVDRVVPRQLRVEVAGEHLDVAGLVHHLRGGVVLGVDPRHRLHDLRGADERALLAVHELRERPVLRLDAEAGATPCRPTFERRAREVHLLADAVLVLVLLRDLLLVDVGVPREVVGVPLRRLRLLVELDQRGAAALVVPGEDGVGLGAHRVLDLVDVGVGDREDRVEVVDVGAADDLGVRCHRFLLSSRPGITSCSRNARAACALVRSIGGCGMRT